MNYRKKILARLNKKARDSNFNEDGEWVGGGTTPGYQGDEEYHDSYNNRGEHDFGAIRDKKVGMYITEKTGMLGNIISLGYVDSSARGKMYPENAYAIIELRLMITDEIAKNMGIYSEQSEELDDNDDNDYMHDERDDQ